MTEKEIKTLQELSKQLMPAGVVIGIEIPNIYDAILEIREDLLTFDITDGLHKDDRSDESIIKINGQAGIVGRSWIFPVDMVIINLTLLSPMIAEYIDVWKPRIVNNGIIVFLNYEPEMFSGKTAIIHEKLADCEEIAKVDNLIAYRIRDEVTNISWAMLTESYPREMVH